MAAQRESEGAGHHSSGETNLSAAASRLQAGAREALAGSGLESEGPSLATVALVGVGAALIEPALIPGILIGAGALLAPKLLPNVGGMLRPLVKGVVKAGYSATMAAREMVAQAGEQVEDLVAEARAEHERSSARRQEQSAGHEHGGGRARRANRPHAAKL